MGRPKSQDPGILISFRIPKSLYAWWEEATEKDQTTVAKLLKEQVVFVAQRGLDEGRAFTPSPHWTEELRMQEAEASSQLSEESPFKTRKPKPKQEEPVDLMAKLEESLAVAKAEKDRGKTLARKTVTPNFKKDKK